MPSAHAAAAWSDPVSLETWDKSPLSPHAASLGVNNIIAVWTTPRGWPTWTGSGWQAGSPPELRSNTFASGAWGTPTTIAQGDNPNNILDPRIASNGTGTATVVWKKWDGLRGNLYVQQYVNGTWSAAAPMLDNNLKGTVLFADVAYNTAGNAVAIWQQTDPTGEGWQGGSSQSLYSSTQINGAWTPPTQISLSPSPSVNSFKVALDSSNKLRAIYGSAMDHNQFIVLYRGGATWEQTREAPNINPLIVRRNPFRQIDHVVFDAAGNGYAVDDRISDLSNAISKGSLWVYTAAQNTWANKILPDHSDVEDLYTKSGQSRVVTTSNGTVQLLLRRTEKVPGTSPTQFIHVTDAYTYSVATGSWVSPSYVRIYQDSTASGPGPMSVASIPAGSLTGNGEAVIAWNSGGWPGNLRGQRSLSQVWQNQPPLNADGGGAVLPGYSAGFPMVVTDSAGNAMTIWSVWGGVYASSLSK